MRLRIVSFGLFFINCCLYAAGLRATRPHARDTACAVGDSYRHPDASAHAHGLPYAASAHADTYDPV